MGENTANESENSGLAVSKAVSRLRHNICKTVVAGESSGLWVVRPPRCSRLFEVDGPPRPTRVMQLAGVESKHPSTFSKAFFASVPHLEL